MKVVLLRDCTGFTADKERHRTSNGTARLQAGDVLEVRHYNDIYYGYDTASGVINIVPKADTAPYHEYKAGDRVEVIKTCDGSFTTDKSRPGTWVEKGEMLTIERIANGTFPKIYYATARGVLNFIGVEFVKPITVTETTSQSSCLMNWQEITPKVFQAGDRVRVVSQVPIESHKYHSTNPARHRQHFPNNRLDIGEEFTIAVDEDRGTYWYLDADNSWKEVPTDNVEVVYSPPPTQHARHPAKGDWVRAVRVSPRQWTTSTWQSLFINNLLRVGDIFKIKNISPDGQTIIYNTGYGQGCRHCTIPASWVEIVPNFNPHPRLRSVLTTALPAFSLLGVSPAMHHFTSNDPVIHVCQQAFAVGCTGLVLINLGWLTTKHVAKGFAQWGDRNRRLRDENIQNVVSRYKAIKD